ncbi:MAG: YceI family protein [bacterium]|nr:YceI family protein [bacterium]
MRSLYLIGILGIGLIALSACTIEGREINLNQNVVTPPVIENENETSTAPSDGIYLVDTEVSVIRWRGERVIGNSHEGTTNLQSGNFTVTEGELSGGEFIITMTSLKSDENNDRLETHLKSEDFFQVETYPEAKLSITNVTKEEGLGVFTANANLTIKDITAPISFIARLSEAEGLVRVQADLSIDRTIWGVKYGSGKFFQDLGDSIIKDEMQLMVDITAER